MLKQLHPIFQVVIILGLLVLFISVAHAGHVNFFVASALFIVAAAFGASLLTHEEHILNYNLEDLEQDELTKLQAKVGQEIKSRL